MLDVESDGPIPATDCYSMVCFGAVKMNAQLNTTFYGQTAPISSKYDPEALKISGFTREEHMKFDDPLKVMHEFSEWIEQHNTDFRPMFISDNNGYDWQFINWYFHYFTGKNPFGYSSINLGSLYKGYVRNMKKNFKHLRITKHTHHPVMDAKGNAEAFNKILNDFRTNG